MEIGHDASRKEATAMTTWVLGEIRNELALALTNRLKQATNGFSKRSATIELEPNERLLLKQDGTVVLEARHLVELESGGSANLALEPPDNPRFLSYAYSRWPQFGNPFLLSNATGNE